MVVANSQSSASNIHRPTAAAHLINNSLADPKDQNRAAVQKELHAGSIADGVSKTDTKTAGQAASSITHAAKFTIHVVQSHDTLASLARKYHCSVKAIQTANNLKSDLIIDGHKLKIPASLATNGSQHAVDSKKNSHGTKTNGGVSLQDFKKEFLGTPYKLRCDSSKKTVVDCVTLVWHYLKDCKGIDCRKIPKKKHPVSDGHDMMHELGQTKKCTVSHHKGSLNVASGNMQSSKIGDVVLLGCNDKHTKIGFSAQHLGIVTGVKRDEKGDIVDLKIMHAAYNSVVKEQSLLEFLAKKEGSLLKRTRDLFKLAQVWSIDEAKGKGLMA